MPAATMPTAHAVRPTRPRRTPAALTADEQAQICAYAQRIAAAWPPLSERQLAQLAPIITAGVLESGMPRDGEGPGCSRANTHALREDT